MKLFRLIAIGLVLMFSGAALGATSAQADLAAAVAGTSEVVAVEINDAPYALMFISVKGDVAVIDVDSCKKQTQCMALVDALVKANKAHTLDLHPDASV